MGFSIGALILPGLLVIPFVGWMGDTGLPLGHVGHDARLLVGGLPGASVGGVIQDDIAQV
ncbi:MAG: hypothetical protein R2746_04800 [Acidimicrobiales bacterium]